MMPTMIPHTTIEPCACAQGRRFGVGASRVGRNGLFLATRDDCAVPTIAACAFSRETGS